MLEKTYHPTDIEASHIRGVDRVPSLQAGRPERARAEPYRIRHSPPNVTGSLHMEARAPTTRLQDVLCGSSACAQGCLVATGHGSRPACLRQLVVERQNDGAARKPGRHQIGRRQNSSRRCRKVEGRERRHHLSNPLQRLGASVRLERERFHHGRGLEHGRAQGVRRSLQGRLDPIKDKRLVNWDPNFQKPISDSGRQWSRSRGTCGISSIR